MIHHWLCRLVDSAWWFGIVFFIHNVLKENYFVFIWFELRLIFFYPVFQFTYFFSFQFYQIKKFSISCLQLFNLFSLGLFMFALIMFCLIDFFWLVFFHFLVQRIQRSWSSGYLFLGLLNVYTFKIVIILFSVSLAIGSRAMMFSMKMETL